MFHLFLASKVYRPLATWQSTPWVPWWSKQPPWPCASSMKLPACRRSGGVLRVLLGSSYWFLMKISLLWLEIQYYDSATKMNLDRTKYIKFHPMMHYPSLWSLHNQVYLLSRFFQSIPHVFGPNRHGCRPYQILTNDSIISGQILPFSMVFTPYCGLL